MSDLESVYGIISLGLITLFLPYLFQVVKMLTKWQDDVMLWVSVLSTYLVVDLYYIATSFVANPDPNLSEIIMLIIGMLVYPLLVWFGTQGIYVKMIKSSQQQT